MLAALSSLTASARSRWVVIGAWVVLAAAMVPLQGPLQGRAADESDTFMVRGSESLKAKQTIDANFRAGAESAAVIVYFRDGGLQSPDQRADGARRPPDLRGGHDPEPEARRHAVRARLRQDRSARPEPGRPGPADVLRRQRRPVDGADDR